MTFLTVTGRVPVRMSSYNRQTVSRQLWWDYLDHSSYARPVDASRFRDRGGRVPRRGAAAGDDPERPGRPARPDRAGRSADHGRHAPQWTALLHSREHTAEVPSRASAR